MKEIWKPPGERAVSFRPIALPTLESLHPTDKSEKLNSRLPIRLSQLRPKSRISFSMPPTSLPMLLLLLLPWSMKHRLLDLLLAYRALLALAFRCWARCSPDCLMAAGKKGQLNQLTSPLLVVTDYFRFLRRCTASMQTLGRMPRRDPRKESQRASRQEFRREPQYLYRLLLPQNLFPTTPRNHHFISMKFTRTLIFLTTICLAMWVDPTLAWFLLAVFACWLSFSRTASPLRDNVLWMVTGPRGKLPHDAILSQSWLWTLTNMMQTVVLSNLSLWAIGGLFFPYVFWLAIISGKLFLLLNAQFKVGSSQTSTPTSLVSYLNVFCLLLVFMASSLALT